MPSTIWKSPFAGPHQIHGPKCLSIECRSNGVTPGHYLDMMAGALAQINGGQLWQHSGRMMPFPEGGPGAVQLTANGAYSSQGGSGRVSLHMVVQPHISDARAVGLTLTYNDFPGVASGLPWMEQVSEAIVATTTLHIKMCILTGLGLAFNPDLNPTEKWTWHMGAWLSTRDIQYGDWTVRLQR